MNSLISGIMTKEAKIKKGLQWLQEVVSGGKIISKHCQPQNPSVNVKCREHQTDGPCEISEHAKVVCGGQEGCLHCDMSSGRSLIHEP